MIGIVGGESVGILDQHTSRHLAVDIPGYPSIRKSA